MNEKELSSKIYTYLVDKFSKRTIDINNVDEIAREILEIAINEKDYSFYKSIRVELFVPNIKMYNDFGIAYYFFLMKNSATTEEAPLAIIEKLKEQLKIMFKDYGYDFDYLGKSHTKDDFSVILYVDKNSIKHFLQMAEKDSSLQFDPPF
jgi:hypothetical protein